MLSILYTQFDSLLTRVDLPIILVAGFICERIVKNDVKNVVLEAYFYNTWSKNNIYLDKITTNRGSWLGVFI